MRGVQILSQNIALNLSCTGHRPFVHNFLLGAGLFEASKTAAAKSISSASVVAPRSFKLNEERHDLRKTGVGHVPRLPPVLRRDA